MRLKPTGGHEEIATGQPDPSRDHPGVTWIDCERLTDWEGVAKAIEGMGLGSLTRAALGHLFEGVGPDEWAPQPTMWADPQVSKQLAAGSGVRFLNVFWARPKLATYPGDTPVLILCKVSFLVGSDWLITNRVDGVGVTSGTSYSDEPVLRAELEREVNQRWKPSLTTPGTLQC